MSSSRVATLEALREKNPENTLTLLMLANEYFKEERWSDTVAVLRDYLARAKDEGAAYRLLGLSLRNLGDGARPRPSGDGGGIRAASGLTGGGDRPPQVTLSPSGRQIFLSSFI